MTGPMITAQRENGQRDKKPVPGIQSACPREAEIAMGAIGAPVRMLRDTDYAVA